MCKNFSKEIISAVAEIKKKKKKHAWDFELTKNGQWSVNAQKMML